MSKKINLTTSNIECDMTKINSLLDSLEYEEAKNLLSQKLLIFPDNVDIIDTLSEVLIGLDQPKEAINWLKKSIELEPNKNPEKYMSLGQFSDYKNSLILYTKGVELYLQELNNLENNNKDYQKNLKKIKNSIASAYASLAELYMNSDLW